MTQDQTDAAAAQAALATALPQISAALDLIGTDDSGATSASGAPHDTAAKANLAASFFGFTEAKVLVDAVVADLNPTPAPVPTPTPTPTPAPTPTPVSTGKPIWAEYHANTSDPNSSVPIGGMLDYGDNNASSFAWTNARLAYMKNRLEIIKMGMPLTQQQCVTFGQGCVAAGHPSPLVPQGWEGNQDVWEQWNEKKYTAAQFKAQFLQQCAWMDGVAGFSPTYGWCPNLSQAGNQAPGRTQFDTNPGVGNFKNPIVVCPDGYDNPGDTNDSANIVAQCELYEANAKANGMEFWGLCETGDNGSDDAEFWTHLLTHAQSAGWKFVTAFNITTSQGGSFNSTMGPNSQAAVEAFYA